MRKRPVSLGVFLILLLFIGIACAWFVVSQIYFASTKQDGSVTFDVEKHESIASLAARLEQEGIIHHAWLFKKYSVLKQVDTKIQAGTYTVFAPVTLQTVIAQLLHPDSKEEREITIIPGWNVRDMAVYFEKEGIASQEDFFILVGNPVQKKQRPKIKKYISSDFLTQKKPKDISFEGYFRPDTFRFYKSDTVEDVLSRLFTEREKEFTPTLLEDIKKTNYSVHEILTLASIVEREVRGKEDKEKVADLFLRRLKKGWALQADSTVHYISGRNGDVFTKKTERDVDSLWNTYKYPGLPPGPIAIPSMESIKAVVYPQTNPYWYFLTDFNGKVHYGKTLDEHNSNVFQHLRR